MENQRIVSFILKESVGVDIFESRIKLNIQEINQINEEALQKLVPLKSISTDSFDADDTIQCGLLN